MEFYDENSFCHVALLALLQLICLFPLSAAAQSLRVTNLQNGETLRYPVALIEGRVSLPDGTPLSLHNDSSGKTNNHFVTSALRGRFKALMELVPGDNSLPFVTAAGKTSFRLRYAPMTTRR